MAEVTRSTTNVVLPKPKPVYKLTPEVMATLTLPMTPSEVSHDINEYYVLIYGVPKIGKTTLAMSDPNSLLLTFDPLQKSLPIMQRQCPDWMTLMYYLSLLEYEAQQGTYPYSRVVLDGCDFMYRYCQIWCQTELMVDHISEEKWARGWDKLKETFVQVVDRFMNLPGGCWFVAHAEYRDIETRRGEKVRKLMPLMKGAAEDIIVGKVDLWAAYEYNGKERVLIVRGDERTGSGCRINDHFLTPRGRAIVEVPMGNSPQEGWTNLNKAFENKQPFITCEERDELLEKQRQRKEAQQRSDT